MLYWFIKAQGDGTAILRIDGSQLGIVKVIDDLELVVPVKAYTE